MKKIITALLLGASLTAFAADHAKEEAKDATPATMTAEEMKKAEEMKGEGETKAETK